MASPRVALFWYCKTPSGWRHLSAAVGRNGKLRPRYAQVGDEQILYPEGHYELRHYENRKAVWRNVGADAATALAEQLVAVKRLAVERAAANAGIELSRTDDQ